MCYNGITKKGGATVAISNKVKSLLKLKGKNNAGLAGHLGISTQALSNKLYRDSFSAADLIKAAEFLNVELAFIVDERQRVMLDITDIDGKESGKL